MRKTAGALAAMICFTAGGAAAQEERLGRVRFPTSCTSAAQRAFDRALALLHSFAYPETVESF